MMDTRAITNLVFVLQFPVPVTIQMVQYKVPLHLTDQEELQTPPCNSERFSLGRATIPRKVRSVAIPQALIPPTSSAAP